MSLKKEKSLGSQDRDGLKMKKFKPPGLGGFFVFMITEIEGIRVGNFTDRENATGLTVVLLGDGFPCGVDVRGSATGTREIELLRPANLVKKAHAILFSGGSAFGLDSAKGVMEFLSERGIGYDARGFKVPIVPAAIIFDLHIGRDRKPSPEDAYNACLSASRDFEEGTYGAGTGATVGKALGVGRATKGGLGTSIKRLGDVKVGALAVVNSFGEVRDISGRIIAGVRGDRGFISMEEALRMRIEPFPMNTTLVLVATNSELTKEEVNLLAKMAGGGVGRVVVPSHTIYDGDVIFAVSTCEKRKIELSLLGLLAQEAVLEAILRAVKKAEGIWGIPSSKELGWGL